MQPTARAGRIGGMRFSIRHMLVATAVFAVWLTLLLAFPHPTVTVSVRAVGMLFGAAFLRGMKIEL